MQTCPCCAQPLGTCDCQLQQMMAANGDHYEWCATHQRTVEAELIPQSEFEEQAEVGNEYA